MVGCALEDFDSGAPISVSGSLEVTSDASGFKIEQSCSESIIYQHEVRFYCDNGNGVGQ